MFVCLYSSLHMSISNVEDVWKPYYIWVDFVSNRFPSLMNISWCYFPIQHTVQSGWQILIPHEDKSMLLFIYSSIQHIVQREWQSLIPFEDKLILLPHLTYCSEGGCRFWFVMKISWSCYPIQHIVQVVCMTKHNKGDVLLERANVRVGRYMWTYV